MALASISDEYMQEMLAKSREYTVMLLKAGPDYRRPDADRLTWEHGRRNFSLRAGKLLSIVCPVSDDSELCGIGIFNIDVDEVRRIMDGDPGVQAGLFSYEVHPCRGFPGDSLPG